MGLRPPSLEKQFLISPPASPPVGWEQSKEMAPVVCNFDLIARLAALAHDDDTDDVVHVRTITDLLVKLDNCCALKTTLRTSMRRI